MSLPSGVKKTGYSTPRKYNVTNFLKNQLNSWHWFLTKGLRDEFGFYDNLQYNLGGSERVMVSFNARWFRFVRPERTIKTCILQRRSYTSGLYIPVRFWHELSDKYCQYWFCVSNLPILTNNGHFIINGTPRVVLNQIVRSPGVYFRQSKKKRLVADFIPQRGAWLRLEMLPSGRTDVLMKNVAKLPVNDFLILAGLNVNLISPYINQFRNKRNNRLGPAIGDFPVGFDGRGKFHHRQKCLVALALKFYGVDEEVDRSSIEKPDIISLFCRKTDHMFKFDYANGNQMFRQGPLPQRELGPNSGSFSPENLRLEIRDSNAADDNVPNSGSLGSFFQIENKGSTLTRAVPCSSLKHFFVKRQRERGPQIEDYDAITQTNWWNYSYQRSRFYNGELYNSFWGGRENLKRLLLDKMNTLSDSNFQIENKPQRELGSLPLGQRPLGQRGKSGSKNSQMPDLFVFDGRVPQPKLKRVDLLKIYFTTDKFRRRLYQPFFKYANYSLSQNGRSRFNKTLGLSLPPKLTALTAVDVLFGYFYLLECAYKNKPLSDIDHLKNRCVRSMGELIQYQLAIGLQHLVQHMSIQRPTADEFRCLFFLSTLRPGVKRRLRLSLSKKLNPTEQLVRKCLRKVSNWIEVKPIDKVLKSFFGTNPLSQFLDMTNSLAELTHKRRLSALGIGGIERTTATMDIRGIHSSHYGRICPIETPEGKNAGLVNSLTSHALLTVDGFIQTPYYPCHNGMVFDEIPPILFGPQEEKNWSFCSGDVERDRFGLLLSDGGRLVLPVPYRTQNQYSRRFRHDVDYVALSPTQMISVATSHIPFLEHNDGNRALMGSNMQRQAVPTVIVQKPIVGTGFESQSVANLNLGCHTKEPGFVGYVDGQSIILYGTGESQARFKGANSNVNSNFNLSGLTAKWSDKQTLSHGTPMRMSDQIQFYKSMVPNHSPANVLAGVKTPGASAPAHAGAFASANVLAGVKTMSGFKNFIPLDPSSRWGKSPRGKENSSRFEMKCFWHYDQSVFYGGTQVSTPKYLWRQSLMLAPAHAGAFASANVLAGAFAPAHAGVKSQSDFLCQVGPKPNDVKRKREGEIEWSRYKLDSFDRSNQDTYRVHRPSVEYGDWVRSGDLLADNSCSCQGELAVGQNILVGYTPWQGYNFEDAVLLNERMIYDDVLTSLHIERYKVDIRETVFGSERLYPTPDGVLQKDGVIPVGTWVEPGQMLVSKYAPTVGVTRTPYEALLFDVLHLPRDSKLIRDTSVLAPHDVYGRVIHVEYIRSEVKDKLARRRNLEIRRAGFDHVPLYDSTDDYYFGTKRTRKVKRFESDMLNFFSSHTSSNPSQTQHQTKPFHLQRQKLQANKMDQASFGSFESFRSFGFRVRRNKGFAPAHAGAFASANVLAGAFAPAHAGVKSVCRFNWGRFQPTLAVAKSSKRLESMLYDKQPSRYVGQILIYIAVKRRIQVGDKISGRHGNKGIVSRILPREDMPYLQDGTPLDVVLNPLGVPSRMNVGQIYETLLGLAGSYLHQSYKICPFDEIYGCEASRSLVYSKLYQARLLTKQNWLFNPNYPGKVRLFDGRTGQCFEQPVTVGKSYILKLIHMVDEKIHARNTGPYSLITQQPVRGRSKQGGQRIGEMEGWAIEGYAAPYVLHELFSIKSDDLIGRAKLQNDIIEENPLTYSVPEAFRVLMLELRGLCTNFRMFETKQLNSTAEIFNLTQPRNIESRLTSLPRHVSFSKFDLK